MTVLRTTIGLPGSGKTTDAIGWVAVDPTHRARINRDDLRSMMHGGYLGTRAQEDQVTSIRDAGIIKLLRSNVSVVVDDTNLRWGHVGHLQRIATRIQVDFEVISYLHVDMMTCIDRDAQRDRPVGADVIESMWRNCLRNQIETWRYAIVAQLNSWGYSEVTNIVDRAIGDPLGKSNAVVTQLAGQLAKAKIAELAPSPIPMFQDAA